MRKELELSRRLVIALAAAIVACWVRRRFCKTKQQRNKTHGSDDLRTYNFYSTAHENYRLWPDYLLELFNLPVFVIPGIIAIVIFLLGLAIALPFGFAIHYLVTPAVYLGLAGIVLVIGACHWGSLRVHPDYEQLRPIFTVDDATYRQALHKGINDLRSAKGIIFSSALFFSVAFTGLVAAYSTSVSTRRKYNLEALRPNLFTPQWYSHQFEGVGFSIMLIFLILISITVGTGGWLLVQNMVFLSKLRKFPVIPIPTIVRARLRRIADLYVGTSLTWSLGVALFGILFYKDYNLISGAFLGVLFLIGLVTFALPQVIFRAYIGESHERLCTMGLSELYDDLGISLQERNQTRLIKGEKLADNLSDLYTLTDRPKTWVYDGQTVVLWVFSELVALAAILPHSLLARLFQLLDMPTRQSDPPSPQTLSASLLSSRAAVQTVRALSLMSHMLA